jgi:hypothetical protein
MDRLFEGGRATGCRPDDGYILCGNGGDFGGLDGHRLEVLDVA